MFPSSAISVETFPSGGDGNKIKERYAIGAKIEEWRKGSVAAFSGERGSNGDWS